MCDADAELARAVAATVPGARATVDWRAAIKDSGVNAVVVATPVYLHREMVLAALAEGKDILCEKPLGLDGDEAALMAEAARSAARIHMVHFGFRFLPAIRAVHDLLADGSIGRPQQLNLRHLVASQLDPGRPLGWRHRRALAGMGALGDLGIHSFDLVRWWVGGIERISAVHAPLVRRRPLPGGDSYGDAEVDDTALVIGELVGGAVLSVHVSRCAAGPPRLEGELFGTHGAIRFTRDQVGLAIGEDRSAVVVLAPWELATDGAHDRFLAAVRNRTEADPSFVDAVHAQRVADAAVRSGLRDGEWQIVP